MSLLSNETYMANQELLLSTNSWKNYSYILQTVISVVNVIYSAVLSLYIDVQYTM